jgi:hypothetical protein
MKQKLYASIVAFAFVLSGVNGVFAQKKAAFTAKKNGIAAARGESLSAQLPASDAVAVVDLQRMLNVTLPEIFSGKSDMLAEINSHIDEIRTKSGIDLRQFEQLAVGVKFVKTANDTDYAPVVLARGKINAPALLATGRAAANGKYREEQVNGRKIYIFTMNSAAKKTGTPKSSDGLDRMFARLDKDMAITALDDNTLAFGVIERVREVAGGKSSVDSGLLASLARNPTAVVNFALSTPGGMSQFLKLDNDELSKHLAAIRQISGSVDVAGGNATTAIIAKSASVEQAKDLQDTLVGFQSLLKSVLGGSKSPDNKIYARMLESLKISRETTDVAIDLQVANADITSLINKKTKQ